MLQRRWWGGHFLRRNAKGDLTTISMNGLLIFAQPLLKVPNIAMRGIGLDIGLDNVSFFAVGLICTAYMTFFWWLRRLIHNDGLVDFAWPSSFTFIAYYFYTIGSGDQLRRLIISSMYILCGSRMMLGWLYRLKDGPDRRWDHWRSRWVSGQGLFGIKNVEINFFAFYQAQNLTNLAFISIPLYLASRNVSPKLDPNEIFAIGIWAVSFLLENVADLQLLLFKVRDETKNEVMQTGLWRFSRHPNYFFEFMIWCSYSLFAWSSAGKIWHYLLLVGLPVIAYWFLVHFTGVPMTEQASLLKRGAPYRQYQETTNRFFPWFPKKGNGALAKRTLNS